MRITFKNRSIVVHREPGDPKYYGIRNAAGESRLFYAIKKHLNALGFDLIKKRMVKDGHLMDAMQQYIRTRKPSGNPNSDIMIYNDMWAIRGAEECYNAGSCRLCLETNIFAKN